MIDGLTVAIWAILSLTLVMHIVASLVLAAFPVSSVFLSSLSDEDEQLKNGNGHNNRNSTEEHLLEGYLLPIGAMLLRIISVVTLLVFVVCVVFIAALTDTGWTGLLLALLVVFVVKILVSLFNTLLVRKYLIRVRTLARPLVAGFNYIASADAIKRLADNLSILPGSKRAYYLEVADLIKTGLSYLEEVNIPAEERELRMIRGILRMDVVKVREIMTPRPDILAVGINDSVTDVLSLMREGGHSKLPVYETSLDNVNNIRGVLFALDLLGVSDRDTDLDIPTLAREAVLVTEFQSVETLLRTFQQQRTSMALVVNEHGGIDGLVTVTDVIEEIVGELMDEFDKGLPELQTVSRHEILADAGVTIDQLNQVLGVESQLPEDVDTIGGLIYGRLDKMPQLGDQITEGNLRVSVTNMTGRRVRRVRITQMKTPDENS